MVIEKEKERRRWRRRRREEGRGEEGERRIGDHANLSYCFEYFN